jgi:hypothetical protein
MKYNITLVASAQIILLFYMLRFSNKIQIKFFWIKKMKNILKIFTNIFIFEIKFSELIN